MRTKNFIPVFGPFILFPFFLFDPQTSVNIVIDPASEVKKALDGQVIAWNNGDLEKAMSFYWNSPEMLWVSKAGTTKGYQPVLDEFKKDFADKSKMGVYSYESLLIEELPDSCVYFVLRWKIVLHGQKIMGGISSQVWKKIGSDWLIVAEHAS